MRFTLAGSGKTASNSQIADETACATTHIGGAGFQPAEAFFRVLLTLVMLAASAWAQDTAVEDRTHASQVMGAQRAYRVYLPPTYASSAKRYPVIYWLHGYESLAEQDQYGREISDYVKQHDVIVVKAGPVETVGQFPLYFPELVEQVDGTLRTLAARDQRAVTGYSAGGFMALWIAGKFPDLLGSASSFMGPTEFTIGPKGFDVESNFDDFHDNYDGVRTRLVTGSRNFIRFYHQRLNDIWSYARANHETEEFDSEHGTPGLAKTFDFHMKAFANPLPKPALFSHADVYPNFTVWGWEAASDRRQPGITVLENVSSSGFRSAVREWIPRGATLAGIKLSITSAPRMYAPGSAQMVSYVHLADRKLRRTNQKADAQGRLSFELDGDAYEVGIGQRPVLAISSYQTADTAWATAEKPIKLRVKFLNKGGTRSVTEVVRWESPNAGVSIEPASSRLFGLEPGETGDLPVTVTVDTGARAMVKIVAVTGGASLPLDIPLFPPAESTQEFRIADGSAWDIFQGGTAHGSLNLGEGNGDAHASPGESFAVLLPDGDAWRAAELFTNETCVDNSVRASDSWSDYDHTGASVKYSLPRVRPECPPGTRMHFLARVVFPNAPLHQVRYWSIELPVWYAIAGGGR